MSVIVRSSSRHRALFAGAASLIAVAAFASTGSAATVVVNTGNLNGWTAGSGTGFSNDSGSLTTASGGKVRFSTSLFNGKTLNSLTSLSYETFISSRNAGTSVAPSLNIVISTGSLQWKTLVYEPVYSSPATTLNTWQTWDTLAGKWWVTGASSTYLTWSQVLALYGTKNIASSFSDPGFSIQAGQNSGGSPWSNFAGAVDHLTIGFSGSSTTYDFGGTTAAAPVAPLPAAVLGGIALLGKLGLTRRRQPIDVA